MVTMVITPDLLLSIVNELPQKHGKYWMWFTYCKTPDSFFQGNIMTVLDKVRWNINNCKLRKREYKKPDSIKARIIKSYLVQMQIQLL